MEHILHFMIPFGISLALTPVVRLFALKNGFVAYPRADRWHKKPTALLGGVGIYLAFIITLLFFLKIENRNVIGLLLGSTFLFLIGLADDRFHFYALC